MLFEQGRYYAVPGNMGTGQSSKGTPYFWVEFNPSHRSVDGSWQPTDSGENRTLYFYLSDAAFAFSQAKLDRLGFNGDFERPVLGTEQAKGFEVDCVHEVYDGSTREKWDLPGTGVNHEPTTPDVIRRLNAMYRQAKGPNGGAKRPAGKPTPAKPAAPALQQTEAEKTLGLQPAERIGPDGIPF
jgi:hypothetical protein